LDAPAYRCGDFQVDAANRRFSCRGAEVALEPKTFAVILQLLSRPGELVTRNELLDLVWGHRYVTPSTLSRVIALARRAFNDDIEEPRYIQTVHGAGYRYVGPVDRELGSRSETPVRFAPPPIARLPARLDTLIGRERELETLNQIFSTQRAVTVLGPGGMGKTQCALEWARQHSAEFPDGVWFFDLAPLTNGADWLRALASALSIPSTPTSALLSGVRSLLQGRVALLLLDNCDRVAAEVGGVLIELLRGTDLVKVLATSQAPLNFLGEHVLRLPPLALPAPRSGATPTVPEALAAAAVQMFTTRIAAVQPAFTLSDANVATVVEICRRLDGMPLALELAAARFASLAPEHVLQRLNHRFRFLSSDLSGRDARHRNLLALLEWSFSLLSTEEQQLLSWFSVFAQGWTVEAAIHLGAPVGRDPEIIVELLTGLVNKSLVWVDTSLDPPRYHLLETVREYAANHLRASAEESPARRAHLDFVVHLCRGVHEDMTCGRIDRRLTQLMQEEGNLARALEYALENDVQAALAILGYLVLYIKARGIFSGQGEQWCRRALAQAPATRSAELGRALLCQGVVAMHVNTGRDTAEAALREAIELAREFADAWTEAYACGYYALSLADRGREGEGFAFAEVTGRIGLRLRDPTLLGLAGLAEGWLHLAAGRNEAAIEAMRPALQLSDDRHQRHFTGMYTGLALFRLGRYAEAAGQWCEAVEGAAAVGNLRGVAGSIEGCAYIAERLGNPSDAARFLAAARKVRERTMVPLFAFWVTHHESTERSLRAKLGAEYEVWCEAGLAMREEDAANEARAQLREFSAGSGAHARRDH
jgi:predicted ATPase/DNA-binding winged helix-turn-helix (wHTH) protein